MTPVSIDVSKTAAVNSGISFVTNALPGVVVAPSVFGVTAVGRHALRAVGTSPSWLAPTLLWQITKTMFRMTSFSAHGLVTRGSLVLAKALALKRLVDTLAETTVQSGLANSAVRTAPSWMTSAHSWHNAFSMNTVWAGWFITSHSLPAGFTDAFEASVAESVDTARKWDALFAKLAPVADLAVTGEGLGTVAIDAGPIVDFTQRCLAKVVRIAPAGKAPHLTISVAVVRATILQVFGHACKFVASVQWREVGFGLNNGRGVGAVANNDAEQNDQGEANSSWTGSDPG